MNKERLKTLALSGIAALMSSACATGNKVVNVVENVGNNPVVQDVGKAIVSYGDIVTGKEARIAENANTLQILVYVAPFAVLFYVLNKLSEKGERADRLRELDRKLEQVDRMRRHLDL